jgi:DNA polymerase III delta prime subunit
MKFYETQYDEYIASLKKYNIRSSDSFPATFENQIIYGPSGVGKYSQALHILNEYHKETEKNPLHYEKKMTIQLEKQSYTYHISDIHYEIDMSFLGCNSKPLWHEIFQQIVDIIHVKQKKLGIILCKNFHSINSELLEIFYSYMQYYNHGYSPIKIKFLLITEHLSFIPDTILSNCKIISCARPTKEQYNQLLDTNMTYLESSKTKNILNQIDVQTIVNIKEVYSFANMNSLSDIPKDNFNTICDKIIDSIQNHEKMIITEFRDTIYDILIYGLDAVECVWYIFSHFIRTGEISNAKDISDILQRIFVFLKYYNNNYRPIYHLESIFFYMIIKINSYAEFEAIK